ncbi:MAG: hypothetical protein ABJO36_04125 [Litorimonas sp.]
MEALLLMIPLAIFIASFLAGFNSQRRHVSKAGLALSCIAVLIVFSPFLMKATSIGAGYLGFMALIGFGALLLPPVAGYWSGYLIMRFFSFLEKKLDGPKLDK